MVGVAVACLCIAAAVRQREGHKLKGYYVSPAPFAVTWDQAVIASKDGTATVSYIGGPCTEWDHGEVRISGPYAVLTVYERNTAFYRKSAAAHRNFFCTANGLFRSHSFSFNTPINGRAVVDGGCGRAENRGLLVCGTRENTDPPCPLIDGAADCAPSERMKPDGELVRPLRLASGPTRRG